MLRPLISAAILLCLAAPAWAQEFESVWSGRKAPLDALNAAVERGNLLLDRTSAHR